MKFISSTNYLYNVEKLFVDYDDRYYDSKNIFYKNYKGKEFLIFKVNDRFYYLTCNKSVMFLMNDIDDYFKGCCLHNVPLMLSSTDIFMFSFIKMKYLNKKTLFDFEF